MAEQKRFFGTVSAPPQPPSNPKGMLRPGNVNIYDRPIVPNGRNSSTVRSVSYGLDDGETLVPSVSDGEDGRPPHLLSTWAPKGQTPEALQYFRKYGKSLGTFDTPEDADAYGQALHLQQAQLGNFSGRTTLPPLIHPQPEPVAPSLITIPPSWGKPQLPTLGMPLLPKVTGGGQ